MASGEMTEDEFTAFLTTLLEQIRDHSADGAIAFVCMDWRHLYELLGPDARRSSRSRTSACGRRPTPAWARSTGRSTSSSPCSRSARRRTSTASSSASTAAGAPTSGPIRASTPSAQDATRRSPCTRPSSRWPWSPMRSRTARSAKASSSIPFLGSGTTVIAAEITGRRAAGLELDPLYVDCAVRRWQQMTGKAAVLAATGETFEAVAIARGEPAQGGRQWLTTTRSATASRRSTRALSRASPATPSVGRRASPNVQTELKRLLARRPRSRSAAPFRRYRASSGDVPRSPPEGHERRRTRLLEGRRDRRPRGGRRAERPRQRR